MLSEISRFSKEIINLSCVFWETCIYTKLFPIATHFFLLNLLPAIRHVISHCSGILIPTAQLWSPHINPADKQKSLHHWTVKSYSHPKSIHACIAMPIKPSEAANNRSFREGRCRFRRALLNSRAMFISCSQIQCVSTGRYFDRLTEHRRQNAYIRRGECRKSCGIQEIDK